MNSHKPRPTSFTYAAGQYLVALAACLVIGAVMMLAISGIGVVHELPYELLADSRDDLEVRRIVTGSVAFAAICMVARAVALRRRGHISHDK